VANRLVEFGVTQSDLNHINSRNTFIDHNEIFKKP